MKKFKKLTACILSIGLVLIPVSPISYAEGDASIELKKIREKYKDARNNLKKHEILDPKDKALLANTENNIVERNIKANKYLNDVVIEIEEIKERCKNARNHSEKHKILDAEIADTETKLNAYKDFLANAENDTAKNEVKNYIAALAIKKEFLIAKKTENSVRWWKSLLKALTLGSLCRVSYIFMLNVFAEIDYNYRYKTLAVYFWHLCEILCSVSFGYCGIECVKSLVELFK